MIRAIITLLRVLNSEAAPAQISLALAFAMIVGLTPLWSLHNAVITPHISGPSTPDEIAAIFNDNLQRYLSRRPLRHVVDRTRGY